MFEFIQIDYDSLYRVVLNLMNIFEKGITELSSERIQIIYDQFSKQHVERSLLCSDSDSTITESSGILPGRSSRPSNSMNSRPIQRVFSTGYFDWGDFR